MTPGIYEFGPRQSVMAYGRRSGNIEWRWKQHRWALRKGCHYCAYLQNAWNKYGEYVFEFSVLETIEDPDERRAAEQAWLDKRHAAGTCYNSAITAGGAGPLAEETKRKMSIAKMGNQNAKGSKRTEEQKQAQSERMMGKQNRGHSERMMGHPVSDATRQKMSKSAMGNQRAKGYRHAEASKRNIGGGVKRYWARKRAMAGLSLPVLIPNPSRPMLFCGGYRK